MIPNIKFVAGSNAITYRQGTDAAISLTVKDATNTPIDVSGWVIRMVARPNYSAPTAIIDLSTPNGAIVISGSTITINFAQDCVKAFIREQSLVGVYQVEATDLAGKKQVLLDGAFTVLKDLV